MRKEKEGKKWKKLWEYEFDDIKKHFKLPPITYYWTVPLILDHSYRVGKLTISKIADAIVSRFQRFQSFCFSNFRIRQVPPTRYEWSKIRGTVQ
jgi:hypothetical protein